MQKYFLIKGKNQLSKLSDFLIKKISYPSVVFLLGDLGSGKTTFTKNFAKKIKIKNQITSPTFLICKTYSISKNSNLIHYDLYRIKQFNELIEIGFEDYLKEKNIIFVEWADKVKNLKQKIKKINKNVNIYKINFMHTKNIDTRKVKIFYEK